MNLSWFKAAYHCDLIRFNIDSWLYEVIGYHFENVLTRLKTTMNYYSQETWFNMDSSPELKILLKYHEQLAVLIRNNLEDIARFLHGREIINREKYREVTDSKSGKTDDERAKLILRWLNDKVEENNSYYLTFYDYLKSREEYSKISAHMNEDESLFKRISSKCSLVFIVGFSGFSLICLDDNSLNCLSNIMIMCTRA